MRSLAIPDNELQRLATLRALHILDTPFEERFDRITRLAKTFLDFPTALISIIDEQRVWFKSRQGLSACEVSRENSFCDRTMRGDEIFVVPDTLLDPYFRDNMLVVNPPHVRFYAGCPLVALDGSGLGSFCLIDQQPRQLSNVQIEALRDFGTWAQNEINATQISQVLVTQRESEARIRAVMESTTEAMLLIAPNHHPLAINRRFTEFFALSSDKVLEEPPYVLHTHLDRVFAHSEQVQQLVSGKLDDSKQQFTTFVVQDWPQKRELELFSTPVYDADEQHIGRLYVFRDVTHEREFDRMKSDFVAQVSHELRTPLTAIKGYVDLFVEGNAGPLDALQQKLLTIVQTNTDRLITLINDLLDLSRIEEGHIEIRRSMVDLTAIIENVVTLLEPQIAAKQQTLRLSLDKSLPRIFGDGDRLTQVFMNLLSNAHHYTQSGGTIMVTSCIDGQNVCVEVQDTGIGMTPEEQAHTFTKFFRAKNRLTEEVTGTGLGLAITRSIVELHGGKIGVVSAPSHGSTFTVFLPMISQVRRQLVSPRDLQLN